MPNRRPGAALLAALGVLPAVVAALGPGKPRLVGQIGEAVGLSLSAQARARRKRSGNNDWGTPLGTRPKRPGKNQARGEKYSTKQCKTGCSAGGWYEESAMQLARLTWARAFEKYTRREFQQRYKISRSRFERVCHLLRPRFLETYDAGHHVLNAAPMEVALSMTLRYVAGGHALDIADRHGVALSTAYRVIERTIDYLFECEELKFPNVLADEDLLEQAARGFSKFTGYVMRGCVGALDGIAIRIRKPALWDDSKPSSYYSRKGFFALNCQAVCDSKGRFYWANLDYCGSTHDYLAYSNSPLRGMVEALPNGYWVAADEAYVCTDRVITPIGKKKGRKLAADDDGFNFWQSNSRIRIEMAFGKLVRRFPILQRPLQLDIKRAQRVVMVCMYVHNLCVNDRLGASSVSWAGGADVPGGARPRQVEPEVPRSVDELRGKLLYFFSDDGGRHWKSYQDVGDDSVAHVKKVKEDAQGAEECWLRRSLRSALADAGLKRPS